MLKRVQRLIIGLLLLSLGVELHAQRVSQSEVPDAVIESFRLAHPKPWFRLLRWEQSDMGYTSTFIFPEKGVSSLFQSNGEWISTRWPVPESSLPIKAHDLISEKYAFYQLRICMYEEDRWNGRHYYALFSMQGMDGYMTELCFNLKGDLESIDGKVIENIEAFEPLNEQEVLAVGALPDTVVSGPGFFALEPDTDGVVDSNRGSDSYQSQSRKIFNKTKFNLQLKTAKRRKLLADSPVTSDTSVHIGEEMAQAQVVDTIVLELENETPSTGEGDILVRDTSMVKGLEMASVMHKEISVRTFFPQHIQETFNRRFPKAENVQYFREQNGDYKAVFVNYGKKTEAVFLPDGTHTTTALFFGKKDVSYPIQQYIDNAEEDYRFVSGKRIVYESKYRQRFPADEKPQNYYHVVVWKKEKVSGLQAWVQHILHPKERLYYLLTFDQKAHFVSSIPYDYVGSNK